MTYNQEYYQAHKEEIKAKVSAWQKEHPERIRQYSRKRRARDGYNHGSVSRNREIIKEAKLCGCARCGEKDPRCLLFHHIDPSQKESSVGRWTRGCSEKRLRDEISKCDVLCFNCHAKVHS